MLRRNFLKALALAAVAPTLAVHAETIIPVVNPHQKYIDALVLFDKAIEINKSFTWAGRGTEQYTDQHREHVKLVSEHMNELFAFLMANFVKPNPGDMVFQKQVRELLETQMPESLDSRLRSLPPKVAEMMWPVAVAKSLLSEHKVRVAVPHMPAFGEFVEHYKQFIIA